MSQFFRSTGKVAVPASLRLTKFDATHISMTYGWSWAAQNSQPHFSITGEIWSPGDRADDPSSGGAIGDDPIVTAMFPHLRLMALLHLNNALTGEPLYAVENTWYHMKRKDTPVVGDTPARRGGAYLGVDPVLLEDVMTKDDLTKVVERLRPTWAAMAQAAHTLYDLPVPTR